MIGQVVSHYRIIGQLGEGGMGVVYVAEDTRLGRRVALKIPTVGAARNDNQHHARFLREARSISALNHPHIATVFDFGETEDGRPFIVMELIDGRDLGEWLRAGELTLGRAVEIVEDVAEALAEAHRRGIVHRDIKPSNVLINERGVVKVVDFGLAKLIEGDGAATSAAADHEAETLVGVRTRSDVMLGTPLYLSPEQVKGQRVDGRSDLFALGALLYECLAGRPAFAGQTVLEIAAQVLHVHPPPPSQFNARVPAALDRVALKAIAKAPEARYQTAAELIADLCAARKSLSGSEHARTLRQIATATATGAFRSSALVTLSGQLRRPRISLGAVLLTLLAVLAGVWGLSRLLRPAPHQPKPETVRLYETGVNFLRGGAYHQASAALERAVQSDEQFALAHARLAEAWTELDYTDKAKDEMLRVNALVPDRESLEAVDALYLDAVSATVTREFPRAIKAYGEIARLEPERAHVYVDLGRAYEKAEDMENAIAGYREATNRDPQDPAAYLRLGVLYGRKGDLQSATAAFDKAEAIYRDLGNGEGRTEVLYQRGDLLSARGEVSAARVQLEGARDLARTTGNRAQQIRALLKLSSVAFNENQLAQGQADAREAIELAQSNGMENLTARGLVDLGNIFLVHGDYNEAEKYYRQALDLARRYKVRRVEAAALLNLGSLHVQQSKPNEAVNFIKQSLAFYQQGNYRREILQAQALLGRANRSKGDYEAALQAFEGQLQLAERSGDQSQAAFAHEGLGTIFLLQERWPEALHHFEQRYFISKALGGQLGTGYGLAERGSVLWQLGRYDEAREALNEAAALADRPDGGFKELLVDVYVTNAELSLSRRQLAEVQAQATRALALTKNTESMIRAKRALCLAQTLSGAPREGRRACEEVVELAKQTGDPSLISSASLTLAQALLEGGNAREALTTVLQVGEEFARRGQLVSKSLACTVAARASQRLGDQSRAGEYAACAAAALANLRRQWGADAYNSFLKRPDVEYYLRQSA